MGLIFQKLQGNGPKMKDPDLTLEHQWVWIVIRRDDQGPDTPADWHLQGIAADEALAIQMCIDETYLIGPLPLNTALPHDRIEWLGSYFPLRK